MKQKDLMYLALAVVIMLVAGFIVYSQLSPKNSATANGVAVDKIGQFQPTMGDAGVKALTDPLKSHDFSSPVEFSGLNNPAPFGN